MPDSVPILSQSFSPRPAPSVRSPDGCSPRCDPQRESTSCFFPWVAPFGPLGPKVVPNRPTGRVRPPLFPAFGNFGGQLSATRRKKSGSVILMTPPWFLPCFWLPSRPPWVPRSASGLRYRAPWAPQSGLWAPKSATRACRTTAVFDFSRLRAANFRRRSAKRAKVRF